GGVFTSVVDCFAVNPAPLLEALVGKEMIIHNAAFDLAFLRRLGFEPSATVHDTMLLSRLLYAGAEEGHTLEDCAGRELGVTLDKQEQKSDWSGALRDAQLAYAAADAAVLPRLLATLRVKVVAAGLQQAADIEARCLPAFVWMADAGVAIDRDTWQALA